MKKTIKRILNIPIKTPAYIKSVAMMALLVVEIQAYPAYEEPPQPLAKQPWKSGTTAVTLSKGTLRVSGKGAMEDYEEGMITPWASAVRHMLPYPIFNVVIEDGVTHIGDFAFVGGIYPESVTIPSSVSSIGQRALWPGLSSIIVAVDNAHYSSDGGVLFNKDKTALISYPSQKQQNAYAIPSSVTTIRKGAFFGCWNMRSVTIPNSVSTIEEMAFSHVGLESVTIPGSVKTIGKKTFMNNIFLRSVIIENGVAEIGEKAFYDCRDLTTVTIGDGVKHIGEGAFFGCTSLTSIRIPSSVTSVGENVFFECASLTSINVAVDNANYSSKDGVLFNKNKSVLIRYPPNKQGAYIVPRSVTYIEEYAFAYCNGLTSITLRSLKPPNLNNYAFLNIRTCVYVPAISVNAYRTAEGWDGHYVNAVVSSYDIALRILTAATLSATAFVIIRKLRKII